MITQEAIQVRLANSGGPRTVVGMGYMEPELWYRQLATCHAAASGLITDPGGRVLMVKPNYREGWSLPGGVLEADERPEEGCAREVLEEVGLSVRPGRLLVLDWVPAGDGRPRPFVSFVFDCGTIAADTPIRLQLAELDEYRFLAPDQAAGLFPAWAAGRLAAAVAARHTGTTVYLPMFTTG
jgi:8-oxo-dGTP pyrophosphatase MutT (NUDIX family)